MYKPIEIANTFIAEYGKESHDLSHMKLQKLVYMVHGWWLAYYPNSPILSEKPQLWRYGPVFNTLYHQLRTQGMRPLKQSYKVNPFEDAPVIKDADDKLIQLMQWVWTRYGSLTALELSEMTHKDGTAWKEVAKRYNFRVPKHMDLPNEDVINEFVKYREEFGYAA